MREKLQGFEEALLEVRKVTKVTTGGRRMRFRAIILVGDRGGNIGIGVGKGNDVAIAVTKATHDAYKNIKKVSITTSGSIPYMITATYKSCAVVLRPAGPGTGLKAGSSVRTVLELSGYENILSKIMGSNNKLNNAIAAVNALTSFKVDESKIQKTKDLVVAKPEDKKKDYKRSERKPVRKPVAKKKDSLEEKTVE